VPALDQLADDLRASVRRATAARAEAGLVAQFDGMRADVEGAIEPIREGLSVLNAPELSLNAEATSQVRARREWLQTQLEKVRAGLEKDPSSIRRGGLWRETKKAIDTLGEELSNIRLEAYNAMLAPYSERDLELLDSLPPGTSGVDEYRTALRAYENALDRVPSTPAEVAAADQAGRRLREIRERVEAAAVPAEFSEQWRALRGSGLGLTELTDEFRDWLATQGLNANVVLVYRGG
jgi:hypothetical protein